MYFTITWAEKLALYAETQTSFKPNSWNSVYFSYFKNTAYSQGLCPNVYFGAIFKILSYLSRWVYKYSPTKILKFQHLSASVHWGVGKMGAYQHYVEAVQMVFY